ncbi:P-loop NTPase [Megalodesulfovibrio paquesii]
MSEQCKGCPSQSQGCTPDSCGTTPQEPREDKLTKTLSKIKRLIVVLSGKGGVGKSTMAANLAVALSLEDRQVGLLDVDIHGPSVPRLFSLRGEQPHAEPGYMEPVPWSKRLSLMSLGFLLPDAYQAVIWRGPVKMGAIRQFIEDVTWGELDYLVVDCPPGTGDEPLSVMQLLGPRAEAVIVTTPQAVAVDDVRRSVSFVREMGNPILGVVENMSGFVCGHCQQVTNIFSAGGGEHLAAEMGVPFLGRIPLDPELARAGDEGYAFLKVHPEHPTAQAVRQVAQAVLRG